MSFVKKTMTILSAVIMTALLACTISMQYYPEETSAFIGYRFYTVLTDSMEPTIPTFSLVMTKIQPKDAEIKPDTIITFHANRFGDNILLTHYFRKTEVKDGVTYYRTQAEGKDNYDAYETRRSDIIGTYVFHIPYLGKIFLFLKSKFGFIMYAELAVVWLVNKTIRARWEEKEVAKELQGLPEEKESSKKRKRKKARDGDFVFRNLLSEKHEEYMVISGIVINKTRHKVRFVVAELIFYDEDKKVVSKDKWYLIGKGALSSRMSKDFEYIHHDAQKITDYEIKVIAYKK